eukprot:15468547-Alexandrium_andersonii.AAC.1
MCGAAAFPATASLRACLAPAFHQSTFHLFGGARSDSKSPKQSRHVAWERTAPNASSLPGISFRTARMSRAHRRMTGCRRPPST